MSRQEATRSIIIIMGLTRVRNLASVVEKEQGNAPVAMHVEAVDAAHVVVARPREHPQLVAVHCRVLPSRQLGRDHPPAPCAHHSFNVGVQLSGAF